MTTTTLTPSELAQQWQRKLGDAQRELSDFEQRIGTLALTNDANELAQRLTELKNAVTIAEAASKTATAAAPDPAITRKAAQLETARSTAAQWKAEMERWSTTLAELEPAYAEARGRAEGAARMLMMHENSMFTYQAELNDLIRKATK